MRNFINNIKRLIYWFPVIWQDRDWDHYYLTKIIQTKLLSMQKFYTSGNAWSVESSTVAEQIQECIIIMDRILEDDYNKINFLRHDLSWGELKIEHKDGHVEFTRENAYNDEHKQIENKMFMKLCEEEYELRKADIKKVFELISQNLEKWWD